MWSELIGPSVQHLLVSIFLQVIFQLCSQFFQLSFGNLFYDLRLLFFFISSSFPFYSPTVLTLLCLHLIFITVYVCSIYVLANKSLLNGCRPDSCRPQHACLASIKFPLGRRTVFLSSSLFVPHFLSSFPLLLINLFLLLL